MHFIPSVLHQSQSTCSYSDKFWCVIMLMAFNISCFWNHAFHSDALCPGKKTLLSSAFKEWQTRKGNNRVFDICGYFFLKNHSRECFLFSVLYIQWIKSKCVFFILKKSYGGDFYEYVYIVHVHVFEWITSGSVFLVSLTTVCVWCQTGALLTWWIALLVPELLRCHYYWGGEGVFVCVCVCVESDEEVLLCVDNDDNNN